MPLPNKGETRSEYISRFMSDDAMKKKYPDKDQRLAVAYSHWRKHGKESMFCFIKGFETKETEAEEGYIKSGYIATTHLDSGFYDYDRGSFVRDKIAKETLEHWAHMINEGNPRFNKMSIHHNREPHVAGVMVKGSAHVDHLLDGEYGLYVDTFVDKTREDFKSTQYQMENGLLDSFSIEFTTRDPATGEYLTNAVREESKNGYIMRSLLPGTILEGATYASQPMNEYCVMIKELLPPRDEIKQEIKIKPEIKEEVTKMPEAKEVVVPAEKKEAEAKEVKVLSNEEKELIEIGKNVKDKEAKEKMIADVVKESKEVLAKELAKMQPENKVQKGNPDVIESKELKEFKEVLSDKKADWHMQVKMAGKIADMAGLTANGTWKRDSKSAEAREYKNFACNGRYLEYKGLGITTNQNTDTDYLLSAAELADVFDPVVYNILNQQTVTWNILEKEDYSNKGNNMVQFTLKIAANTTAGAYAGNAINTGNVTRLKYETKFKKYSVGVEIDGDMIAAARGGPIGDVLAREVADSTVDLMSVMNAALFAEVGLESATGVIGFEYITDQAGNTALYNLTRSQANGLASTTTADNYINGSSARISITNLRAAARKVKTEGGNVNRLVWITSFTQGDMFRGIYDAQQRTVPTSSRFGFEGRPEFDGIPIFEDVNCNSDDWFLVDLDTHRIAIWVPPTLEMLGKDSDSEKGFIKCYWCTYNRAPRRMVQIYGNATS